MLKKVLPEKIFEVLDKQVGFENIYEIRLRAKLPVCVVSAGKIYYLSESGLTYNQNKALKITKDALEDIVYKASQFSIYSITEELKNGFIVLDDGVRIGVCGSVIMQNGQVKTITNFSSLNIRVPHEVVGACLKALPFLLDEQQVQSTLIISPPGQGKTTFLRDFARQLSLKRHFLNVLVLDERGEIAGKDNCLNVGDFCDVLSFCTKQVGFLQGIRALNPHIIMTDELGQKEDFEAVKMASNCGVSVVATIHASSFLQLQNKPHFEMLKSVFQRYVLLSATGVAGQIEGVFDQNFQPLFGGQND